MAPEGAGERRSVIERLQRALAHIEELSPAAVHDAENVWQEGAYHQASYKR
jgi:hypothetical protein